MSDGSYLIAGKQVTGFTNGEEQNLGRYPWLRRANRREIEIEAGEMPGASPASRLREILVFVGSPLSEHGDELEHAVRVEVHERFAENQELRIIDQRDGPTQDAVSC